MRYCLTCLLMLGLCSVSRAQIARMEYFIDSDPGIGQATPIGITPGSDITPALNVPLTNVSLGFHALYLRARDAQGRWSLTYKHPFYTTRLPPTDQALTAAEYFIDQDPGPGRGRAIVLPAGQTDARLAFAVDLSSTTPGPHSLFLRVADKSKNWSQATRHAFYVKAGGASGSTRITAFRYNFTRPSYTSSTRVYQVPNPTADVNLNFNADLSQLPVEGDYDLNIWAISSDGQQSLVRTRRIRFTVLGNSHALMAHKAFTSYPNPFEQETTIEFELTVPQRITMFIRDVHGRVVATPVKDRAYGTGIQKIFYINSALPAGLYFCEVQGEQYNQAIKLVKK